MGCGGRRFESFHLDHTIMEELVFDAQLGAWVYLDIYFKVKPSNKLLQIKRGFFPYSYNFVLKKRGEEAQCSYCGKFILMRDMTRDHTYPKSQGGKITTTSCKKCNTKKRNLKPIEFALLFCVIGVNG